MYHGLVTFLSFIIFGAIPLILYIVLSKYFKEQLFGVLLICMTIAFIILGALRSKITNEPWYYTSGKMVLMGNATSILAYLITFILFPFPIAIELVVHSPTPSNVRMAAVSNWDG